MIVFSRVMRYSIDGQVKKGCKVLGSFCNNDNNKYNYYGHSVIY